MAALAAAIGFTGRHDTGALAGLLRAAQADRGPDGESVWSEPGVALSVRHLFRSARHCVVDHRVERPVLDCVIAWDGRLDNRDELAVRLGIPARSEANDAVFIAHGWRRWGNDLPSHLLGDFAFALWDQRERTLFCARDPVGARPLYYTWQRDFLALASDDEALIRLPGVSAAWHPDRLFYRDHPGFSAFDWQNAWRKDVLILMPGHSLLCTADGRLRRTRWHDWGPPPAPFSGSLDEAAAAFGECLEQATRDRTRDIETIGVIASGGIDSLAVLKAAVAVREGRAVRQFSVVHDDGTAEIETRSIMQAAEMFGLDRHWLHVPSFSGVGGPEDLRAIHASSHPVDDTIPLIALLCKIARRRGTPYLLHGVSGDAVLWASDHYTVDPLLTAGLNALPACWREASRAAAHHTYLAGTSVPSILLRSLLWRTVPPRLRYLWRLRHDGPFGSPVAANAIGASAQARRAACTRRHWRSMLALEKRAWRSKDAEYLDQLHPIGVLRGLEGYQRVAGRWGIDLADPFSDARVIKLARAMAHQRTRDGWTKAPVRFWVAKSVGLEEAAFRSDKTHLGWLCARPGDGESDEASTLASIRPGGQRP